jgi:hypothetical protein
MTGPTAVPPAPAATTPPVPAATTDYRQDTP